jgi:hypothetical protein
LLKGEEMAAFREDDLTEAGVNGQEQDRLDWQLMRFGSVALFRKSEVLSDAVAWLKNHGYVIAQVDCSDCHSEHDVLWAIGHPLGFNRWPLPNLDGFNDDCRYIMVPEEGGIVIVLRRFEHVAERLPEFARGVLDILACTSWDNLLFGGRMICLVQSENPWIQFGSVGGREPWWNPREWLNDDRA